MSQALCWKFVCFAPGDCYESRMSKNPLDKKWYNQHPQSRPFSEGLRDGCYVYVEDIEGIVWVLPDFEPHLHVRVLGERKSALYAGDFTIQNGCVTNLTNCSGTFQFDDTDGLLRVAGRIRSAGVRIIPGAIRLFPYASEGRPRILR